MEIPRGFPSFHPCFHLSDQVIDCSTSPPGGRTISSRLLDPPAHPGVLQVLCQRLHIRVTRVGVAGVWYGDSLWFPFPPSPPPVLLQIFFSKHFSQDVVLIFNDIKLDHQLCIKLQLDVCKGQARRLKKVGTLLREVQTPEEVQVGLKESRNRWDPDFQCEARRPRELCRYAV